MLIRWATIVVLLLSLFAPSALQAEVSEEHNTEILKPVPHTSEPTKTPDLAAAVKRVILLTNQFREQEKQEPVIANPQLQKAAEYFADYMARTNRYGQATVEYKMADRTYTLPPQHIRTHQVCRLRDLAFRWQAAEGEGRIVQPKPGDHFVVTKEGEALQIRKD